MIPPVLFSELIANGRSRAQGKEIDHRPVVKIYDPNGAAMWLLTEVSLSNPKVAFGLCDTGQGCPELGYVDLSELAYVRTAAGGRLEIDRHFRATQRLSEYAADAHRKGRIVA